MTQIPQTQPVPVALPSGYAELLDDVKERIRTAQTKAALSANTEMVALYWEVGRAVCGRQRGEGWGRRTLEHLSRDLQKAFPGLKGFSPRNIWRMRAFYLAWTEGVRDLPQPVAEVNGQNLPQAVAGIPWGHNSVLLEKLRDPKERLWYAHQTIEHGWSRSILTVQIETDLYRRQGKAITNFRQTLPPPQSDLAEQVLKHPYVFDFLTLTDDARERELELGLLDHLQRFLLELGVGFAFVGRQVHLDVGEQDFYLDLLFYHLRLRCFVVIDRKAGPFQPEYAGKMDFGSSGQCVREAAAACVTPFGVEGGCTRRSCHVRIIRMNLNFHLSAVDDSLRHPDDQPTIGLLLCKEKNRLIVEYALRDVGKPIGVADREAKLVESLPEALQGQLPTVEEREQELGHLAETSTSTFRQEGACVAPGELSMSSLYGRQNRTPAQVCDLGRRRTGAGRCSRAGGTVVGCLVLAARAVAAGPEVPAPVMHVSFDGHLRAQGKGLAAWQGMFSRSGPAHKLDLSRVESGEPRFEAGRFGQGLWMESGHYGNDARGQLNFLSPEQANPERTTNGFEVLGTATLATLGTAAPGLVGKGCLQVKTSPLGIVATAATPVKHMGDGLKTSTFIGSAYIRTVGGPSSARVYLRDAKTGTDGKVREFPLNTEWQRVHATFDLPEGAEAELHLCMVCDAKVKVTWQVDALMLEHSGRYTEARHPSSWVPGQTRRGVEKLEYPIRGLFSPDVGTVSFWVQKHQESGRHTFFCVGDYWDQAWMIGESGNGLEFTARRAIARTRARLEVGKWHHIAMAWDDNTVTGYLDGEPVGKAALKPVDLPPLTDYFLRVGNATGLVTGPGGVLDELLVFDTPLAEAQVHSLAQAESAHAQPPVSVAWAGERTAFSRDERKAAVSLAVSANDPQALGELTVKLLADTHPAGQVNVTTTQVGKEQTLALPFEVGRLGVGQHDLTVEACAGGRSLGEASFPLVVGPYKWRDRMPFLAWTSAEQSAKLAPFAEAGVTAIFNGSPRGLDNCVAVGLDGGAQLNTWQWRRPGHPEDLVQRQDGTMGGVWWHSPKYQAHCRERAEAIRDRARANPHFRYHLINTEHHSELNFSEAARAFAKQELGFDMPLFSINGLTHPPYLSVAWSKRIEEAYPADLVIPPDNQWMQFYKWFYQRGSGVNVVNDRIAEIINDAGPEVVTIHDPVLRWPPVFNYKHARLQEEWVYVPDPKNMLFVLERSKCNARGKAEFAGMPQLLFKNGVAAPHAAAVPPDMMREALWLCLSRPVDQLTVWGWHLILDDKEHNNPETLKELGRFSREVLQPYGPLLRTLDDRPREVGYLYSLASDLFRKQRWHWEPPNRYKALAAAGVLADVLYDESLVEDEALAKYRALVLPGVTALTRGVYDRVTEFIADGGLVIADELLGPKIDGAKIVPELEPTQVIALLRKHGAAGDSVPPNTIYNWRTDGAANYLVLVNDKREAGPLFGEYGKVKEKGIAQAVTWQAPASAGQHVYSLRQSTRLEAKREGDILTGEVDLPPCGGDILAFYTESVGKLAVHVEPSTVRRGEECTVTVELQDADRKPFRGSVPFVLTVTRPDGSRDDWGGYHVLREGWWLRKLPVPLDVAAGEWHVEARELANGATANALLAAHAVTQ